MLRTLKTVLLWVCLVSLPIIAFWAGGRYVESAKRVEDMRSQSRFAQMEVALLEYHKKHGAFPPTKYQPVAGGPIHSWRVLLLPYTSTDYKERYPKYDFSQEWNSTKNLQALGRMACPLFRMNAEADTTQYLAISNGDEWPSDKPLRSRLITKGNDRFLVVEFPESQIHWMEAKF